MTTRPRPDLTERHTHREPPKQALTCDNGQSEAGPRANGTRPLTHSLDYTEEGLGMKPTHFAGRLSDILTPAEHSALALMRDQFGIDASRTYQFWEHLTARMIDGHTTTANCPWDVEAGLLRVEVKFSQEFTVTFRAGQRRVFKWTSLRREQADVTVLFGIDAADDVFLWVAPSAVLANTATVISPRSQIGESRSPLDCWHVPLDQLLPAVLRTAREVSAPLFDLETR